MSKKTKKEKIIAELRRRQQFATYRLQTTAEKNISEVSIENTPKNSNLFPPPNPSTSSQTQSLYIYPVHLIKKDLTKTLLLCILAISLELALFFILKNH